MLYARWYPVPSSLIEQKIDDLNSVIYKTRIRLSPDDTVINVACDKKGYIDDIKSFYDVVNSDKNELVEGKVIYFTKQPDFEFPTPDGIKKLSCTGYHEGYCDAPYDPDTFTLLIHGPEIYGYFKSLILGVCADIQQESGRFAVHAGVSRSGGIGRAYIGITAAGKTTHSIGTLHRNHFSQLLTDDWSVWSIVNKKIIAEKVEHNIMLTRTAIKEVEQNFDWQIDLPSKALKQFETGEEKCMVKTYEISAQGSFTNTMAVDIGFLLLPRITKELCIRASKKDAVEYIIGSAYHIPFNYPIETFRKDEQNLETILEYCKQKESIKRKIATFEQKKKQRIVFWNDVYERIPMYFVSTRKEPIRKTHESMEALI